VIHYRRKLLATEVSIGAPGKETDKNVMRRRQSASWRGNHTYRELRVPPTKSRSLFAGTQRQASTGIKNIWLVLFTNSHRLNSSCFEGRQSLEDLLASMQ
jgi:hypothetical protein